MCVAGCFCGDTGSTAAWSPKLFARQNRRFRDGLLELIHEKVIYQGLGVPPKVVTVANQTPIGALSKDIFSARLDDIDFAQKATAEITRMAVTPK